jgi:hypothetical protein
LEWLVFFYFNHKKGGDLMGSILLFIVLIVSGVLNLISGNIIIAIAAFVIAFASIG